MCNPKMMCKDDSFTKALCPYRYMPSGLPSHCAHLADPKCIPCGSGRKESTGNPPSVLVVRGCLPSCSNHCIGVAAWVFSQQGWQGMRPDSMTGLPSLSFLDKAVLHQHGCMHKQPAWLSKPASKLPSCCSGQKVSKYTGSKECSFLATCATDSRILFWDLHAAMQRRKPKG